MSKLKFIGILLLVFVALYAPTYFQSFNQRNSAVEACERGNKGIRAPLFTFLENAKQSRLEQARITRGEEREVNMKTAADYREGQKQMIEAAKEDGVLLTEAKPYVDCQRAYSKPFPF